MQPMTKYIDWFVPDSLKSASDMVVRRARLVVVLTFLIAALSVVFSLVHHFLLSAPIPAATCLLSALGCGGILLLLSRTGSISACGHALTGITLVVLTMISLVTGGLNSPAMYWVATAPVLAALACGSRQGLAWLCATEAIILGVFLLPFTGKAIPSGLTSTQHNVFELLSIATLVPVVLLTCLLFEWSKNEWFARLERLNRDLYRANHAYESQLHENRRLVHDLEERVKEMRTVNQLFGVLNDADLKLEEALNRAATLLPNGFQSPDQVDACIWFDDRRFGPDHYRATEWMLSAPFIIDDGREGRIEAAFREQPSLPEGTPPFIDEERQLLETAASALEGFLDRRLTTERMVEQKTLLDNVLHNIPCAVFWKDLDSRYLGCNQLFADVAGIEFDQIVGKSDYDSGLKKEEADKFRADDRAVMESGEPLLNIEEPARYADGAEAFLLSSKVPLRDHRGQVFGLLGVFTDITKRKQMEVALRRSEERFRLATEATREGIWEWDIATDTSWFSNALREQLGYDGGDRSNASVWWRELFHPEDRDRVWDSLMQAVESGKELWFSEYRLRKRGGSYAVIWDRARILRDERGKAIRAVGAMMDVSDERAAQDALKESERFARSTVDALSAHIAILDADGTIIAVNQAWRTFAEGNNGVMATTCEGANYIQVCEQAAGKDAEGAEQVAQGIRDVIEGRRDTFMEEYPCHAPSEQRWFIVRVTRFAGEGAVRIVVAHENITARKLSEESYRTLVDHAPIGVVVSRDMKVLFVNATMARILGAGSADELVGRNALDLVHPEYREISRERILRIADHHEMVLPLEEKFLRVDGEPVDVEVIGSPCMYNGERAIQGVVQDISARKRAEAALRESTARLAELAQEQRLLIENTRDIIYRHDIRGVLTYVSPSIEHLTGFASEYWLRHYTETLTDNPINREVINQTNETLRTGRENAPYLFEVLHRDGHPVMLEAKERPIVENGQVVGIIGVARDVTERFRIQEEMKRAKEAAEAANRAKSMFLANINHEIRTPMTAILGFADQLLESDLSSEARRKAIATIRRSGRHLLDMINDILDLSKIEADRMTVEKVPYSPCELLADVISVARARAEEKGVAIELEFTTPIPESITTDPTRLRQILLNLVSNAVKFTHQGSVRLIAQVIERADGDPMLQLDVVDTGIGLTADQSALLFEPFTQADASTTRSYGGTGLGLTISQRLARLLGGDIELVETQQGVGSRFRLTTPAGNLSGVGMIGDPQAVTLSQIAAEQLKDAAAVKVSLKGFCILLAEDGVDNQRLIAHLLERAGAEVELAENGELAFEAAREASDRGAAFDVILMDMPMPVLDGYDATRQLRKSGYKHPIVALTAHAMTGDRAKCLQAGCDDYISKPIDRHQLIQVVARHAARARRVAEAT